MVLTRRLIRCITSVQGMNVAVARKLTDDSDDRPISMRMDGLKGRIDRLVDALNLKHRREGTGLKTDRSTVIRAALRGRGLAELERSVGIDPPADDEE